MGTSDDDGARESNNWLDQWQRGKLVTGSRVQSLPRASLSSNEVPFLLLNQPNIYVVVQFYPWFKFYFLLFLGMLMYDNEFKTKENKI